jgi:hypothetical protein
LRQSPTLPSLRFFHESTQLALDHLRLLVINLSALDIDERFRLRRTRGSILLLRHHRAGLRETKGAQIGMCAIVGCKKECDQVTHVKIIDMANIGRLRDDQRSAVCSQVFDERGKSIS